MSGFGWILGGLGGIGADGNTNNDYSHSNNDFTPTSTYIFKPIPSKSTSKSKPKPFSFASFSFTSSSFSQKCPPKPEPDVFTTTLQSLPPNLSLTPTITTLSQIISTLNYTIDYYYFSPSKPESGFQSTNCSPFPLFTYNLTTLTDLLSSLDITYTTHLTSYLTTLQLLSHSSRSTSSSITSDINLFKKAIGEIETAKKERRFWRKGRHIGKLHDEARVKLGNIRKTLNEYRDEMEHSVGLLAGGAEEVNNLIVGVEGMVRGISIVENKEGVRKCVKEMREKGISGVEWAEMEREIEAIYGGVVGRGLLDELLVENKWLKQMFEAQIMAWEDVMGWWYVFADDKQMGKGNSGGNKNGHGNEDVMYCGCFPSIPMEIKKIERGGEIGMSENEEDKSEIKMLFQWIEEVGRWEMGRKEFAKEMEGAVEIWLGGLRED
ncbi:hypothetical protein EAF00_012002 [Botryotinia globosa]|nr:hypothetical protein EAF00_012002 [Botryotinia globosa]